MKSTKALQVPGGCVVQVTTQQRNPDGSYALAEALTYVPGVEIREQGDSKNGTTRRWLAGHNANEPTDSISPDMSNPTEHSEIMREVMGH